MHLATILCGYFNLSVFTVHVSAWISPNFSVDKVLGGSPHSAMCISCAYSAPQLKLFKFFTQSPGKWDNSNGYLVLTFDDITFFSIKPQMDQTGVNYATVNYYFLRFNQLGTCCTTNSLKISFWGCACDRIEARSKNGLSCWLRMV